jgi:hypothetical protein
MNTVQSRVVQSKPAMAPNSMLVATIVLVLWFALVVVLAANESFVTPQGTVPVPIALGFGIPIVLFFAGLGVSGSFRNFVFAADLRQATAIQAWRFAGIGFLALYAYDVLPATFALPAGIGDIAIGITAPWILVALIRRPVFAASTTFIGWNLLGILDLVVAVSTGALGSALASSAIGEVTTLPMAHLPLVLIPAFFVPIFIMLHIAALLQARQLRASGRQG